MINAKKPKGNFVIKIEKNETRSQIDDAPNAADFLGGDYLKREDMRGPIVVTITDVWSEVFRNSPRKKRVVSFQEIPKPLILNKTNIRRLANVFQTENTALWRGPVTLYLEKEVQYAGQIVGGMGRVSDTAGQIIEYLEGEQAQKAA